MNRVGQFVAAGALVGLLHASGAQAAPRAILAPGESTSCIPFDTTDVHIVLHGTVNDTPLWFTLDTGASSSVLDATRAKELGLAMHGSYQSLGAGGAAQSSQVDSITITLPGYQLADLQMGTLDLQALSLQAGHSMDGVLGHEVFQNSIVEVDYLRGCVTLHDPHQWRYTGKGAVLPLHFRENHPYVSARVTLPDGRVLAGEFVIDTGSGATVILSSDTVERENVIAAAGRTITSRAHGVGGMIETKTGRLAQLDLGPFSFAKPTATFQPAGAGRISAPGTLGNIGGGVLNRFTVIFDYPHARMILEPDAKFGTPFDVDMSGIAIVSAPPDFQTVRVARVMDDSPAAAVGVQVGDEIRTVNGVAVSKLGLARLRRMMKDEGQELRLELRRSDQPVTVTIRTRRLI